MGDVWHTVRHEKLSPGNTKCLSSLCKYNIVETKDDTDYNPHGSDKVGFVLQLPLIHLQPMTQVLFEHFYANMKEYKSRQYPWHNGNGKGYLTSILQLLFFEKHTTTFM